MKAHAWRHRSDSSGSGSGVARVVRIVSLVLLALVGALVAAPVAHAAIGDYVGKWGTTGSGDGQFVNPSDVVVASNGDVYVVDAGNNRIQYFGATGAFKGEWGYGGTGNGQFMSPQGIAIAPNGDVYVTDANNDRVQYFSATGAYKGKWGHEGTGNGLFQAPRGVAVAPNGDVYVADVGNHRVQYFSATGAYKGKWGSVGTGDGQFSQPRGVALAPNGDVYVTDLGNNRVQYFGPAGAFRGKWGTAGSGDGQMSSPMGIAVAANGDAFVADSANNRVQYFGPTGVYKGKWGSLGTGNGQFNYPHGITHAPSGHVYVTEITNRRVQYFEGPPRGISRLSDRTRFSTAVAIAKAGYPGWAGVKHVVIASGDDRAAADPLAASGLCWAYDAPMLLVSAARTPDEVKAAIKQITDANGTVTLHVVGGPVSVPDARLAELITAGGGPSKVSLDRLLSTGGRYDMARAIALRMKAVRGAEMPKTALFANGADATKFFDALALSPISAGTGAPILLVTATSVPTATQSAITSLAPTTRIVGGGPNTVSEAVRTQLGATRWSGRTRYDTAIAIADGAVGKGWLDRTHVGIAAKLPDALTGGSFVGRHHGVLLLTDGATLTPVTKSWLTSYQAQVKAVWVFGGQLSVSDIVLAGIGGALQ